MNPISLSSAVGTGETRAGPLAAYGALGFPLAMAALPVYVQIPAYYSGQLGLSLALTGLVLFAARLIDTFQDPWLGAWVDSLARRGRLMGVLWWAALGLSLAFAALWLPPVRNWGLAVWLGLALVAVYTAHSLINIAYLSWGARLMGHAPEALRRNAVTRGAAWREGSGLAGVMVASVLPAWLLGASGWPPMTAMAGYGVLFAVILLGALAVLVRRAPRWESANEQRVPWRVAFANRAFRRLLPPYFLNALAVSIPATLALFFINDRLDLSRWAGVFLAVYFASGALGLPLWTRLALRFGVARAWRASLIVTVCAFVWASLLGPGDALPYLIICVLAGLALGADLALPPVLLARHIPVGELPAGYYGYWSLLGKLALAMSGLALPVLAFWGYQPGTVATGSAAWGLSILYGIVPCVLKIAAWISLRANAELLDGALPLVAPALGRGVPVAIPVGKIK